MFDDFYSLEKQYLNKTTEKIYSEPVCSEEKLKKKPSRNFLRIAEFIFVFSSFFLNQSCIDTSEIKGEMKKEFQTTYVPIIKKELKKEFEQEYIPLIKKEMKSSFKNSIPEIKKVIQEVLEKYWCNIRKNFKEEIYCVIEEYKKENPEMFQSKEDYENDLEKIIKQAFTKVIKDEKVIKELAKEIKKEIFNK